MSSQSSESSPSAFVHVIDSHTGGEPTRVVLSGAPPLGDGPLSDRCELFGTKFDEFRSTVVSEPRTSEAAVGALLCPPQNPACATGVIFFNNLGTLGMCVHGAIGVAVTLGYLERVRPGPLLLETPVGVVSCHLDQNLRGVTVGNVPSYRHAADVEIELEEHGPLKGDVAWGGNWFFLLQADQHRQILHGARLSELTAFCKRVRGALVAGGVTGAEGAEIDHIELFAPSSSAESSRADSRNFVLCPGGEYDRSPCGTGTSAKLACLAAQEQLEPGVRWRQQSIIGSVFEGWYDEIVHDQTTKTAGPIIRPMIHGSAYINTEATIIVDPQDPFRAGLRLLDGEPLPPK